MQLICNKIQKIIKEIPVIGPSLVRMSKTYSRIFNQSPTSLTPEEAYYQSLNEDAKKLGLGVAVNSDSIDVINGDRVVRVNRRRHNFYTPDIINNFEYYFSAVQPVLNNGFRMVDYSQPKYHDVVGFDLQPIFFSSFAEPVVTNKQYADFAQLKQGDTVIDLGGYSGLCAIMLKDIVGKEGRVITVEADADNYSSLLKNCNLYKKITGCDIEILYGAIFNHNNGVAFSQEGNMGSSAIDYVGEGRGNRVSVPSFTLSKIAELFNISRVDFIKCDVEGAEAVIFEDDNFFAKYNPRIIIEAHYAFGSESINNGIHRLEKYGYSLREVRQDGLNVDVPLIACTPCT